MSDAVSDPSRADRHRALSNVFEQLAVADVLNVRAYVCVHKAYVPVRVRKD